MNTVSEITARTTFTAAQILAEHPDGLRGRDLWPLLRQRLPDVEREWEAASTGETSASGNLDFYTIDLVKAGWLRKSAAGWFLTPVGRAALREFPDPDAFFRRHRNLYRDWDRNKARFGLARQLIEAIPEGSWASDDELGSESELEASRLVEWLQGERPEGWHRVLDSDGGLPDHLSLTDEEREEWLRMLSDEGVPLVQDRADPAARVPGSDLSHLIRAGGDDGESAVPKRAWLIRGSSVQGANLIRDLWLPQNVCSLPASRLRELPPGVTRTRVKAVVDADYSHATVQQRARMAAEYHAFLSRMRENDIVATNDGADLFLGVVTGPPTFVSSVGNRANLQRTVRWQNKDNPVDYGDLPDEISARLSNPDAELIDLTEFTGDLERFLGEEPEQPVPDREFTLPDITEDFAARLLMSRDWLQECVELLRDRPQLVFYGPPGTGKTYLAQELADYLVGGKPENVQLVQFHPAYSYEDFFEGYRPVKGEDGGVSFELTAGPLRRLVNAAVTRSGEPHVLIIDEINRGNLAKIFGELYFLLEYRGRAVNLLYGSDEGRGFNLPRNVMIIGTMNTADRSIALVDVAMRRRFSFQELHPDLPPVRGLLADWLRRKEYPEDAARLLDRLNARIGERDFKIGPSYLMRSAAQSAEGMERIWRTQILPLLEEHHYGDLSHEEVAAHYGLDVLRRDLGITVTAPASGT